LLQVETWGQRLIAVERQLEEERLHNLGLSTRGNPRGFAGHLAVVRRVQVGVAAVAEDVIAEAELSFARAGSRI